MPRLLRQNAIRMLEASMESATLASLGLQLPRKTHVRNASATTAPQIGLIGAAAELALSGCLIHTTGQQALLINATPFKSGRDILRDFKHLILETSGDASFIFEGAGDVSEHRDKLSSAIAGFGSLLTWRAGGLHGGQGPSREICILKLR